MPEQNKLRAELESALSISGLDEMLAGFTAANTAIQNTAKNVNKLNQQMNKVGSEQGSSKNNKVIKQLNDDINNMINGMKSGTVSATKTLDDLIKKYQSLDNMLKYVGENTQDGQRVKAVMAKNVQAIEQAHARIRQIEQTGASASVATADTAIKEEIRLQKDKVNQLKQIWQDQVNAYTNMSAKMTDKSSLVQSTATGTGLKQNIFNAAIALAGIRSITSELQNMGNEFVDIQYNTINTQRIMQDFSEETARTINESAVATAKATNIQITDAQEIQAAWVRINDQYATNVDLLNNITTLTSKFMNVGEIENAENAVTLLNASLLQFNVSAEDTIEKSNEFLNKWAYMADITAMGTADEYGEAISRFGANVVALNGSMDDSIALASTLADRLGKSGEEAGTSLKTFTSYMNRAKTLNLFETIAEDLGDTNYQLTEGNGKLKDFEDNLRTISKAYQQYKQAGNDVAAQQILEAVGATRQRDAALAILNSVNDGTYDEYLTKVQDPSVNNYLEEQNAALMTTFKAQINEMKVTMQEFFMTIGNSGVLEFGEKAMDAVSGMFDVFNRLNPVLQKFITYLSMAKLGQTFVKYLSDSTSIGARFNDVMTKGSLAQRQQADSVNIAANAYARQMESLRKSNQLSEQAVSVWAKQKVTLDQLVEAYNSGEINAQQYTQAVSNLISEEELANYAAKSSAETTLERANSNNVFLDSQGNVINSIMSEEEATRMLDEQVAKGLITEQQATETKRVMNEQRAKSSVTLTTESTALQTQNKGLLSNISAWAKNRYEKQLTTIATGKSSAATAIATAQTKLNTLNEQANSSATGLNTKAKVANGTAAATTALQNGLLTGSFQMLSGAIGIVTSSLGAFMSVLSPILMISTVVSLFGGLFKQGQDEVESITDKVAELESQIDECKNKLQEYQDLTANGGKLSEYQETDLKYWQDRLQLLEENYQAELQLQAHEVTLGKNGGEDNTKKRTDSSLKEFEETLAQYEELRDRIHFLQQEIVNGNTSSSKFGTTTDYNKALEVATKQLGEVENKIKTQRTELVGVSGEWAKYKDYLSGNELATATESIEAINQSLERMPGLLSSARLDTTNIDSAIDGIKTSYDELVQLGTSLDNVMSSSATSDELQTLANSYAELSDIATVSTEQQIEMMNKLKETVLQDNLDEVNRQYQSINETIKEQQDILNNLYTNNGSAEEINRVLDNITTLEGKLSELESYQELYIDIKYNDGSIDNLKSQLKGISTTVDTLGDLFDEYNSDGALAIETIEELIAKNPTYIKYLSKVGDEYRLNTLALEDYNKAKSDQVAKTEELLQALNDEQTNILDLSASYKVALDASNTYLDSIQRTFGDIEGVDGFVNNLREVNTNFITGKSNADEYANAIDELIASSDFSQVQESVEGVDEATRNAIQSQQAMFSTLASSVSGYLQEMTTSFMNGTIGVNEYVNSLAASNDQLLDLYTASNNLSLNNEGQWINAAGEVDNYANSLQNATASLQNMSSAIEYLGNNYSILSEISTAVAQGQVDSAWWAETQSSAAYQTLNENFNSAMMNMYENNRMAYDAIADKVASAMGVTVQDTFSATGAIAEGVVLSAEAVNAGTNAMINELNASIADAGQAGGNVIEALGNVIESFDYTLSFDITGGISAGGNILDLALGKEFKPKSNLALTVKGSGGSSVQSFAQSLSGFGSSMKKIDWGSLINLDSFRPSSNYTPIGSSGASGGGGYNPNSTPTISQKAIKDAEQAAKNAAGAAKSAEQAATDAAKAAEQEAKAIEQIRDSYISNVESLQKRIANALKKQYQEEYDERKKNLEKEHNLRVDAIQAEKDAINGETPEDKQSELNRLRDQFEKWSQDDSTLGKARQKDYLQQIEDLEKEIKLDELEAKLDKENETYENAINSDSAFYDAILKKLDDQMTEERLYQEANELIRLEKQQEIIDLLTKYDSQWDGWATLMGATAGEVIADEVKNALNNYLDVINGSITSEGGVHTNGSSGGSSSSSGSSSGGSSSGSRTHTVSRGDTLWDLAVKYYGDGTQWRKIQNANGNIDPYTLPVGKQLIIPFKTGGYTGQDEGLAYLHKKERVLNDTQTSAFDWLVYDFLPEFKNSQVSVPTGDIHNDNSINFNRELVSVNIDRVVQNTEFDVNNGISNLSDALRGSLKKSGINLKR